MPKLNRTPTYNLKVVVQETGLKPDTLRVWERRYGLPDPQRTEGGHRLYSERDIATIKWLLARRQEGLSISRAIALWESLEADGRDPLLMVERDQTGSMAAPTHSAAGETVAELRRQWVDACLDFDEQRAEQVLTQAFAAFPPETVALELLQKGLAMVGEGWYQGEVTVQQEHFASTLAIRHLDALVMAAPAPTRPGRALVACPPHEEHTFSPLLLTFLLRRRGWDVLFLGANVPLARLESALDSARPSVVIMPAQQLTSAATLMEVAQLLRSRKVPLAFGGLIFNRIPDLRQRILGHFMGERLEGALQVADQMLANPYAFATPTAVEPAPAYRQALAQFQERQAAIEAELWLRLRDLAIPNGSLATINANMGQAIIAALKLGDMAIIGRDIEWVAGLLTHHGLAREQLDAYLRAYCQAAQAKLDEQAGPVVDWLKTAACPAESK